LVSLDLADLVQPAVIAREKATAIGAVLRMRRCSDPIERFRVIMDQLLTDRRIRISGG